MRLRAAGAKYGDVDVLFNGAGWVHEGMLANTTVEDWRLSFEINVTSMFVLCQAFLPHFVKRGSGNIINIASVASSLKGVPNRIAYMSSKAAVIGLTKSIAFDYMKAGIRANSMCPGAWTRPRCTSGRGAPANHDEAWKTFIARQPMGRMAQPEEMAHLAVYLASDESAYATGANFVVDGGDTLTRLVGGSTGRALLRARCPPVFAALASSHHQIVGKPDANSGSGSGWLKRSQRATRALRSE